jgi:hypothetical protein
VGVTAVEELLEHVAAQAQAEARPPALAVLQRRRLRRTTARAGVGVMALAGVAAVAVLLVSRPGPAPDVVVADPAPSTPAPAVLVGPGQVALPPWAAAELRVPAGAPPVADQASAFATEDGPLVTAVRRDGDLLCWAVFTAGDPEAPAGGASCTSPALPVYRSGRLDLGAASTGPSRGAPVDWLVVRGSAPAGTRTVVLTASGGEQERIAVSSAGEDHLDRAFFALPWVERSTVVEALDASGRTLARDELLLSAGQPPG